MAQKAIGITNKNPFHSIFKPIVCSFEKAVSDASSQNSAYSDPNKKCAIQRMARKDLTH
jgi:hypothetical protein